VLLMFIHWSRDGGKCEFATAEPNHPLRK